MEESKPPSINDCLAQLRQCLDPAAAAAIEQLNAAINARVDRLTQAVEGPSPWLEVGRALVRQVPTADRGASPSRNRSPSRSGEWWQKNRRRHHQKPRRRPRRAPSRPSSTPS